MNRRDPASLMRIAFVFILVSLACGTTQVTPTPEPTATVTSIPTNTPIPTVTPTPTSTPDVAATQRVDEFYTKAQDYYNKGYLATPDGYFIEYEDYFNEWAEIGWYNAKKLENKVSDFFMSAHLKWESAYKNANVSGCGFVFALQDNNDHYAVFLDRAQVFFLNAELSHGGALAIGTTRGSGLVNFTPPAEADLTLIVKDSYAYVLVNNELVGEYTLTKSRSLDGNLGLTVLSGTNKGYGTRCIMTNIHVWIPQSD
jgi:hypothetical protein